jgi:hypothetical protein
MDEIARKRLELSNDCKQWSHVDALQDALERTKNVPKEKVQISIQWFEEKENKSLSHYYCIAGLSRAEHIYLLEITKKESLEDALL